MNILIAYADTSLAIRHGQWLEEVAEVRLAYSLSEALDRCGILSPDLVLLDLDGNDEDALLFFQQLFEQSIDTPVVVITREGTLQQAVQAMSAGAADFLVQPLDKERLLASVQNVLARRAAAQALVGSQPAAQAKTGRSAGEGVSLRDAAAEQAEGTALSQIIPLWQVEYLAIRNAIEACGGSIPKAAKLLEVSVSTLYRKAARLDEIEDKSLRLFVRSIAQ